MQKRSSFFKDLLPILPAILMALLLNTDINIKTNIQIDTILLILGNFAIAYFIADQINKKHKNEEQIKENCFKELDYLLELIESFKKSKKKEDDIIRFDSLVSLQIKLLSRYDFIDKAFNKKLFSHYYKLNKHLTEDTDKIDPDYKITLLRIEETILNIKSNILR